MTTFWPDVGEKEQNSIFKIPIQIRKQKKISILEFNFLIGYWIINQIQMEKLLLSTELFFKNTFPHQDKIELNFHLKNVQKRAQMKKLTYGLIYY